VVTSEFQMSLFVYMYYLFIDSFIYRLFIVIFIFIYNHCFKFMNISTPLFNHIWKIVCLF